MKVSPKNIKFMQEGGPVEDPNAVPAEGMDAPTQTEQDPMTMLMEMSAQALQSQDCNIAMLVCQALLQITQQMSGEVAPAEAPGEPVFRKGGILQKRIRK